MIGEMIGILAAFGLSAATGLNAYLPLLIVGLLARFTDLITLSAPWNTLESPWVLGVLFVLLVVETVADKVPAVDSVNDVMQTVIRPAAGAILFAASGNVISEMSPVLAMICGLLAAGGVHAVKATVRPVITAHDRRRRQSRSSASPRMCFRASRPWLPSFSRRLRPCLSSFLAA